MRDSTPRYVDARDLKAWIHDEAELALLDVREHGQFGENHLFFAVPLPYSELELHIARLAPRAGTRTVRREEHTSEPQALMRTSYAVFGVQKNNRQSQISTDYSHLYYNEIQ